jgi:hypothetical protein
MLAKIILGASISYFEASAVLQLRLPQAPLLTEIDQQAREFNATAL